MVFYIDGNQQLAGVITVGIQNILGSDVPVVFHEKESSELIKAMSEATVFNMREKIHKFTTVVKNLEKEKGVHILNISPMGAKYIALNNPKTKANDLATEEVKRNFNIKVDSSYLTHILVMESLSDNKAINEYVKEMIKVLESDEKIGFFKKITQIVRDESLRCTTISTIMEHPVNEMKIDGVVYSSKALLKIARIIANKYKFNMEKDSRMEAKEAKKQEKLRKKLAKKNFKKPFKGKPNSKGKPNFNKNNGKPRKPGFKKNPNGNKPNFNKRPKQSFKK